MPKATYTVTYTPSTCYDLEDDFHVKRVTALTYHDACVIIKNIAEHFGIVISCDEDVKQQRRRRANKRDQSKNVRYRRHTR